MSPTHLRRRLLRLLDRISRQRMTPQTKSEAESAPVSVHRRSKLDNLKRRPDIILCDPEDLVHIDWSDEWRP